MHDAPQIRPYRPEHRAACLALFDSNVPRYFSPEERPGYEAFLDDLPGPYMVMIDPAGDVVACGGFAVDRLAEHADLCWGMVRSDLHGRGLGRELTLARVMAAREGGAREVALETGQHTMAFYALHGFETVRIERDGYAPGLDRCFMRLRFERILPPRLDRIHRWVRAQPFLRRFTLANRLLLAMAFIPTGLVKATGQRFTLLPVENQVGFFFEAMYQTGPYWRFVGAMQVIAAVLLLIPHTATLGALLFLPIGLSIFLITWGIGFGNTVFITAGMLLSVTYLVCWDADRVWAAARSLLTRTRYRRPLLADAHHVERLGWLLGGATGIALFATTRSFLPNRWVGELLLVGAAAAVLVVIGWFLGAARRTSP